MVSGSLVGVLVSTLVSTLASGIQAECNPFSGPIGSFAGARDDDAEAAALVDRLRAAGQGGEVPEDLIQEAWQAWVQAYDAYAGERALLLARAMHEVSGAIWSLEILEGTCRRLGLYDHAAAVIQEQLGRTPRGPDQVFLLERRALVAAGAGDESAQVEFLGRALAAGGVDAQQVLGRRALSAGRLDRARGLFRGLVERRTLEGGVNAPWALRGWGVTLLPGRAPR